MDHTISENSGSDLPSGVIAPSTLRQQRMEYQLRALELTEMLHRKLDMQLLMECFYVQGQAMVAFDGLRYDYPDNRQSLSLGFRRQYHATFELSLGERALGSVGIFRGKPFTSREERELERQVMHLVYPIRNALEYQRVMRRSLVNPSTDLENRLAFERQLPREMMLARRRDLPLSLLLIDIDHFAAINDDHGEVVGDQVLRQVADELTCQLRKSDMIFQFDTDIFAILLAGTEYRGAKVLAERLRTLVNAGIEYENVRLVTSASAGITEMVENDEPAQMLERAMSALTHAKRAGRNTLRAVDHEPHTMHLV